MLFRLSLEHPILVRDFYKIRRNTVWSQADQNHILVAVTEGECIFTIEGEDYLVGRDVYKRQTTGSAGGSPCRIPLSAGRAHRGPRPAECPR